MFIIESHLGRIDCSSCEIFRRGRKIFAKHIEQPDEIDSDIVVSLPIKVADLSSTALAKIALGRIASAIKLGDTIVDLRDLSGE